MIDETEKDARRYRFLRDAMLDPEGLAFFRLFRATYPSPKSAAELDAAVDAILTDNKEPNE